MPWLKKIFIISLKGLEDLVGILFGSLAFFVFLERIRSSMSLIELEKGKLCCCFEGQDRINVIVLTW